MLFEILAVLEVVVKVIEVVTIVVQAWALLEKFLNPNENAEQMGARMLAASERGVERENFDSYQAYLDSVRQMEVSDAELEKFTKEDRLKKFILNFDSYLNEKYGSSPIEFFIKEISEHPEMEEILKDSDRVRIWFETFRDLGLNVEMIVPFLNGKLPLEQALKIQDALFKAEAKINPGKTDADLNDFINDVKNRHQK